MTVDQHSLDPPPDLVRRIDEVARRLDEVYGPRPWRHHAPPLDELVLTVLSQHTSDVNSERAFASLRARFPTWEAVRTAPTSAVADAIRSGGLADLKARRIQDILDVIRDQRGRLELDHLAEVPLVEARAWLLALPGVGPKTAACVLLFGLGKPMLPVDTHIHRLSLRLGLIPPKTDASPAHDLLAHLLGEDLDRVYAFHVEAIAHGRRTCTARRPHCERCNLTDCCDYYRLQTGDSDAGDPSDDPPPRRR